MQIWVLYVRNMKELWRIYEEIWRKYEEIYVGNVKKYMENKKDFPYIWVVGLVKILSSSSYMGQVGEGVGFIIPRFKSTPEKRHETCQNPELVLLDRTLQQE